MKHSLLLTLFLLLCTCARAQQSVTGSVRDTEQKSLPFATITAHLPGRTSILSFTRTDNDGRFSLEVNRDTVELRTRYLGMETDTVVLYAPFPETLRVQLRKSSNELQSVTVKTRRAPITEKGDTTVFSVRDFRDSTDRKIEDVLRRLPGVEVKEDGSIEVNGQSLHRILIEDSDLFGRRYQLGSRNLNARDIGQVEIIQDYQENAVLQSVNNSTAIVLNLKLEEKVKSVVAGNVILGGGYGGKEFKYSEYASLYRVDRKHKSIFIGDVDNVGNNFGFDEINATYGKPTGADARQPLTEAVNLLPAPRLNQGGLRREFTNNERRAFGTLRHESGLGKNLVFNASLTGLSNQRGQIISDLQRYLGAGPSYELQTRRDWTVRERGYVGEALLNYENDHKTTSLDLFYGRSFQRGETQENIAQPEALLRWNVDQRTVTNTLRLLLSRAVRPGLVLQFSVAHGVTREPLRNEFFQPSLAVAFGGDPDSLLTQNFTLEQRHSQAKASLLWKTGDWLTSLRLTAGRNRIGPGSWDERYWSPSLNSRWQLTDHADIRLGASLGRHYFPFQRDLPAWTHGLSAGYRRRVGGTNLRFRFSSGLRFPGRDQLLYQLRYAPDLFTLTEGGPLPELGRYRRLTAYYGKRNNLKFTNWSLSATLYANDNIANPATNFRGDLQFLSWSFTGARRGGNLTGRYGIFVAPLKSDLKLQLTTGFSRNEFRVAEEAVLTDFRKISFQLEGGVLLLKRLRVKGVSGLRYQHLVQSETDFYGWNNNLRFIYNLKHAKVYAGLSHAANYRPGRSTSFAATFLGAERRMQWKDQEAWLRLRVYNLSNRTNFVTQYPGELFLFEQVVPALGRYFLLTFDFSL